MNTSGTPPARFRALALIVSIAAVSFGGAATLYSLVSNEIEVVVP